MNKTAKIVLGIAVLAIAVWAIISADRNKNENQTKSNLNEPIKIGYFGPLTGESASLGEPGMAGAMLAAKEINDAGGVLGRKLEIIFEDDKCSAQGVQAITKLVNVDKVVGITGPDCSSSGGPALPIAQKAGVPVVIRWASAASLTKIGDFIFRLYPSDTYQSRYIAEFVYNTLGKRKAAVIYVNNAWGKGLEEDFVKRFVELGGQIVMDEGVTQDSRDFRTQLAKLNASGVDVLFVPVYPGNAVAMLKQIKEISLKLPVIGGDIFDADEVIKSPGAEGVMYTVGKMNNSESFRSKAEAETGKKADKISASMAYDAVKALAKAIQTAGSAEGPAVRDALAKISLPGELALRIEFGPDRELKTYQFEVKIIKDGKAENYQ